MWKDFSPFDCIQLPNNTINVNHLPLNICLTFSLQFLFRHRNQNDFEWTERWISRRWIDSHYGTIWSGQKYTDGYFNRLHVSQYIQHRTWLHPKLHVLRCSRIEHTARGFRVFISISLYLPDAHTHTPCGLATTSTPMLSFFLWILPNCRATSNCLFLIALFWRRQQRWQQRKYF